MTLCSYFIEGLTSMFKNINFKNKLLLAFITYGMMLSFVALGTIYTINASNIKHSSIQKAQEKALEKSNQLYNYIHAIHDKLYAIQNSRTFNKFLDYKASFVNTRELFLNIAATSQNIMQLRYIDAKGQEVIRIDRVSPNAKPEIVPLEKLQNKSKRYYFKNIFETKKNHIWHSKIDLNIENGKIQRPFQAVLRAGMPVFHNNEKRGILIINVFMNKFLTEFAKSPNYNVFLIDKYGYFQSHINEAYMWSKYKNDEYTIKDIFPESFENILLQQEYFGEKIYSKHLNIFNTSDNTIVIQPKYFTIQAQIYKEIKQLIFVLIGIILLSFPFAYLFAKTPTQLKEEVDALNQNLEEKVNQKTKELKELNLELENRVKVEVEENSKKDKLLYQQSKIASLGEMLGNIAHQWRQPLSAISSAASGIKLQKEMKILEDKDLNASLDGILKNSRYLSKTIDDFRNYFKSDKPKEVILLDDAIKDDLNILSATLKNNYIQVITDLKPNIELLTLKNELTQVHLNLISNSKDALLSEENQLLENRYLFISLSVDNNHAIINIKDNAGGIPEDALGKIFEPYFTTKHKSQGTGIGLYMSEEIISKHLKGSISVSNETFKYEGKSYKGANFTIKLPLELTY